jgi:hypothetical protein
MAGIRRKLSMKCCVRNSKRPRSCRDISPKACQSTSEYSAFSIPKSIQPTISQCVSRWARTSSQITREVKRLTGSPTRANDQIIRIDGQHRSKISPRHQNDAWLRICRHEHFYFYPAGGFGHRLRDQLRKLFGQIAAAAQDAQNSDHNSYCIMDRGCDAAKCGVAG